MKADTITAKILDEAREQASAILEEATQKADEIRKRCEETIFNAQQEVETKTEVQAAELRDRMTRMAELDQKKALLGAKREMIDQAFDNALERMCNMSADQKRSYMKQLLIESAAGGEELIPSASDAALFDEAFMSCVNDKLAEAGKAPVFLSEDTRNIKGGFVLKEGGLEISCAFEAVLKQARPALEAEVAATLFN